MQIPCPTCGAYLTIPDEAPVAPPSEGEPTARVPLPPAPIRYDPFAAPPPPPPAWRPPARQRPSPVLVASASVAAVAALLIVGFGFKNRLSADAARKAKTAERTGGAAAFETQVKPILARYCYNCHGDAKQQGDLTLQVFKDAASVSKDRKTWEKVMANLRSREMPPTGKPQPTPAERDFLTAWIEGEIYDTDCANPDPGRVTIRRLNRAEYNHTIRDLVGVKFQPADDFPADDSGYGFDNIGDVLSLSPILFEKYAAAADKILRAAFAPATTNRGPSKRIAAAKLPSTATGGPYGDSGRALNTEGEISTPAKFPTAGEYTLRAKAFGQQAGTEPARMEFRLDGKVVKVFDVTAVERAPEVYHVRLKLPAGDKTFAAAFINNYKDPKEPNPERRDRNLIIEYLEVAGPAPDPPQAPQRSEAYQRIMFRQPTPETKTAAAREIIGTFALRAYRRPITAEELDRLMTLFALADRGQESFDQSIQLALQAVLVSPHFLFRGEIQPEPNNPTAIHPVNEFALASRLSYFLWSSLPDDELLALAGKGQLRAQLDAQVKRMLLDPKSAALVENFAGQWLQLRNLKLLAPDAKLFPTFDDTLRHAMVRETTLFVETILRENRSVLDFIDGDFTFLNQRLAKHYGFPGVTGDEFVRVSLKGTPRGGLLTHGSILTLTSNPTRTSPVKRGKWVLENLLGTPPPPPPPDVPELADQKQLTGTLRQKMEQHRDNPVCSSCHARMDPIGFGFENFDGVGAWRDKDGGAAIDPTGELVSGEKFASPAELRAILIKQKREDFIRCLAEKLLTYALGRGLEHYDKCALEQITKGLEQGDYRFAALVSEIVKSTPFQKRRGENHTKTASQ